MHPEISQWYIYVCIKFNWNISTIVSLQHFSDSSPRSITSTLQQKNHFCCKFAHFLYPCHGFSSGTLPTKGSAPVSFHHNLTLRGFDRQALGGEVKLAKAGFKSTFVVSGERNHERQAFNDDGGYATSCAIWPLAPDIRCRWMVPPFSPPKKNTRDVCLTPKTEMKLGIWKKWWCRGKGYMHMHCGRSWSFDSSRYIATILWVFA